jgi:hypothetical protein
MLLGRSTTKTHMTGRPLSVFSQRPAAEGSKAQPGIVAAPSAAAVAKAKVASFVVMAAVLPFILKDRFARTLKDRFARTHLAVDFNPIHSDNMAVSRKYSG